MRPRFLAAAAVLLLVAAAARAQAPELVTDRPDQTESTAVIAPGSVQIEAGFSHTESEERGVELETTELGSTLVRIGLVERLELRVGWGGFADQSAGRGGSVLDSSGAADADLGIKLRLADESGSRPSLALLAGASLPVGDDEVSSGHADPGFLLAAAHSLSDRAGLGYNVGMSWESADDGQGDRDTVYSWVYSVAAGFGLDEKWSAFGEVFGRIPGNAAGESEASLDGGVTYLHRPNLQLDAFAGFGVFGAAPDWFVGLGLSIRLSM